MHMRKESNIRRLTIDFTEMSAYPTTIILYLLLKICLFDRFQKRKLVFGSNAPLQEVCNG